MALAIDASSPASVTATGTSKATASFTPVANSLLVALVSYGDSSGIATAAVTDSLSSSWTMKKRQNASATGGSEIWMMDAGASPAARTVTATVTIGIGVALTVVVFTGAKALASQTATPIGQGTNTLAASITTTTTGSFVVGAVSYNTLNITLTANANTTSFQAVSDATNGQTYATCRSTVTTGTPGAISIGYTNTASGPGEIALMEVLPSAAATATYIPSWSVRRRPSMRSLPRLNPGTVGPVGSQLIPPPPRKALRSRIRILPRVDSGTVGPVGSQLAPPTPRKPMRPRVRMLMRVDSGTTGPISSQLAPPANPTITQTVFRRGRRFLTPVKRGQVRTPVSTQLAPPANPTITQTVFGRLRTVGRVTRRPEATTPIAVQLAPPSASRPRRQAWGRKWPRAVTGATQTGQQLAPAPSARRRPEAPSRRPRAVAPAPAQLAAPVNPAITQTTGRLRRFGARRARPGTGAGQATPVQPTVITNPPIAQTTKRARRFAQVLRRPETATPVRAQVNPPYPVRPSRVVAVRGLSRRRGASVPAAQVQPVAETRTFSTGGIRGLRRIWLAIRRKTSAPIPRQVTTLDGPLIVTDSFGDASVTYSGADGVSAVNDASGLTLATYSGSDGLNPESDSTGQSATYDSAPDVL